MSKEGNGVIDPAAHQSSKAELIERVGVNATPEVLARAITHGGAKRRDNRGLINPPEAVAP